MFSKPAGSASKWCFYGQQPLESYWNCCRLFVVRCSLQLCSFNANRGDRWFPCLRGSLARSTQQKPDEKRSRGGLFAYIKNKKIEKLKVSFSLLLTGKLVLSCTCNWPVFAVGAVEASGYTDLSFTELFSKLSLFASVQLCTAVRNCDLHLFMQPALTQTRLFTSHPASYKLTCAHKK